MGDRPVTSVNWVNLTPGDVARALTLTLHCRNQDAAGAGAIIHEARDLNRIEALSLAMAYTIVESGIDDEKAHEMQRAAMEFRAAELEAERLDDGPDEDDDEEDGWDDEDERRRKQ
jgi:hypothetical protein